MPTTLEQLQIRAELYERKAAGLRLAIEELTGQRLEKKQKRGITGVIDQAIVLRAAASAEHANGSSPRKRGTPWSAERRAKFIRSIKKTNKRKRQLEALGRHAAPAAHAAPTKKQKPGPARQTYRAQVAVHRQESARVLAAFDPTEARTPAAAGLTRAEAGKLGALVRYGYLKTKGDGLVLTAKEFTP